jgi:hypothetical protein
MDLHNQWVKAQSEYWKTTPWPPMLEWEHYDPVFEPYLRDHYKRLGEVGPGPVPYMCHPRIHADYKIAIDPLFNIYRGLKRWELCDCYGAFNYLDHTEEPFVELEHIRRVLHNNGLLYFFVDVGKEPDVGHLYKLDVNVVLSELNKNFEPLLIKVEDSWKPRPPFNQVLYYVGQAL